MTKGRLSWLYTAWLIIILFVINGVKSGPFSGPNITTIGATNATSITVTWGEIPAIDANGYVTHYYVCYKVLKAHKNNCSIRVDGVNKRRTLLSNLNAFTTYVVSIKAATSNGAGPSGLPKSARTFEDKPAKGPKISRIIRSSRKLDVTWSKLSLDDANGVIRKYEVCFARGSLVSDCNTSKIVTGVNNSTTDVTGLTPGTLYTVAVRAYTKLGYGPLGERMSVTTNERVNIKPTRTASMNAARHKFTSNSITLTTMMIGGTTSQITTSQNVPSSNRSSLVVPSASPNIPIPLSTVNVTTDTCTSASCVLHKDSCKVEIKLCLWEWPIICCVVFILIHAIIIGSLCCRIRKLKTKLESLQRKWRRDIVKDYSQDIPLWPKRAEAFVSKTSTGKDNPTLTTLGPTFEHNQ